MTRGGADRSPGPALLSVGLSCLDHVWLVERFPPEGSRTHASGYRVQGGGPAATAAAAAARLGARSALWALHGDDLAGRVAWAELERFGVDLAGVRVLPGAATFVSAVLVRPDGERWIFPYRGAGLRDDPEGLPLARVARSDALLCDLRHPRIGEAALRAAREAGVPTVGDVSDTRHPELWALFDHLLLSREGAAAALGRDDPEAAVTRLRSSPEQVVGVTLGAEGVVLADGGRVRHLPAFRVEAVDTTGAGDVFHGAYAARIAAGDAPGEAARFAGAAAALACTGVGRTALPDAAAVRQLLDADASVH